MGIRIISPKTVRFRGNPNLLKEKSPRNEGDKTLDIPRESCIVYPDLVFALRYDPTQYLSPLLRYENQEVYIVANNAYFKAAKEAGLEIMNLDLIVDRNLPLEELMERYRLEFYLKGIQREYMQRFLFFMNPIRNVTCENPSVILDPKNPTSEFRKQHCIAYKILVDDSEKVALSEHELVAKLFNEFGYLRSINGNSEKGWRLGRYIS